MSKAIKVIVIVIVLVLFILVLANYFVIQSNKNFCINSDIEEKYDENYELDVMGCPDRCVISSCYGLMTSCCPKGLF